VASLASGDEAKLAELKALVESIRDRVRSQYPGTSVVVDSGGPEPIRVPVADLMPIVHARDAAQAKMASIGSVNPRAGGFANELVQKAKRTIARGLNWFVRDQIVFNRGALACVEASVESMNDLNRALASLASQIDARLQQDRQAVEARLLPLETRSQELDGTVGQLAAQWNRAHSELAKRDIAWRESVAARDAAVSRLGEEFRRSVEQFEARTLAHEKSYTDLAKSQHGEFSQAIRAQHAEFETSLERAAHGLQRKADQDLQRVEREFEALIRKQHAEFETSLVQSAQALQRKLDVDLQRIKLEFEGLIHNELRVVRQRGIANAPAVAASVHTGVPLDYQAFSHRFRGSEEHVRQSQMYYAGRFHGEVLDIGCGQGEFLEVMRESGINARGVDLSAESVAYCIRKGLAVEQADLFVYLDGLPDRSLDGIFSSQVVEHLPGDQIPEMIRLCAAKLRTGGLLAIETPNPACLAIFATHFYLDPTHVRPVPSALLAFYMEEHGLGGIQVDPRFPAADSFPELNELPEGVRNRFFGGLDYAIFARKL
jgi:2-polyprenyl-3-methyl-5-hydroxy-6-metoxy-1,4-benzoquinol methylase